VGNVSASSGSATAETAPAPFASTVTLPRTGQAVCYDGVSVFIPCADTGQNGDLQMGASWPAPRFTANSDTTLTDKLTGLAWAPDGNIMPTRDNTWDHDKTTNDGKVTWQHALAYVANLNAGNYLGHNDWRLPNRKELRSLIHYGKSDTASWLNSQGFMNAQADDYWSSTTFVVDPQHAWYISLYSGTVANDLLKTDTFYVWPVRGEQGTIAMPAELPATGQTACYDTLNAAVACANTGQDGELRKGAAWLYPRFMDNGFGTMTDNLTGLVWAKEGNAPGPAACAPGAAKTWQGALAYAACLNANTYLGYTDWRLPDVNEMESLINVGLFDTSAWLTTLGFTNTQAGFYWSSSTFAVNPGDAWIIHVLDGDVYFDVKSNSYFVWPVRGGQ
jgi:hypothetical protein